MSADTVNLQRTRSPAAGALHFYACELVIWAYFLSTHVYKRWYIASALALIITLVLALLGHLTLRGAGRAMVPFVLYHAYLLTGIFRSEHRGLVAYNTLTDVVELVVVFLFWSVIRNHSISRIGDLLVRLPFLAAVVTTVDILTVGVGLRTGGLGLIFLPVAVPFCYEQLMRKHRPRLALFALVLSFAILALSRSRAPVAAAVIAFLLSFLVIGRGVLARLKVIVIAAFMIPVVIGVMMTFAQTRLLLLNTYVRFSGNEIVTETLWIQAEPPDEVRLRLDELVDELMPRVQPFGLGIGGASAEYARRYGEVVAVHNTYHAWVVEGGLFCVLIVIWIFARHARTLVRARRDPALRRFAITVGIATITVLAIAKFHQMHRTPALWMLLGVGAGIHTILTRPAAVGRHGKVLTARGSGQRSTL